MSDCGSECGSVSVGMLGVWDCDCDCECWDCGICGMNE